MSDWLGKLPLTLIAQAASAHGVPMHLVAAIVQTESGGVAPRVRFEPGYRWLSEPDKHAKALGLSIETEKMAQSFSYGLMQIMGGTARGLGYRDHCALLITPSLGLHWGCLHLSRLLAKHKAVPAAVAAYNAGSPRDADGDGSFDNQPYVDKVLARLKEIIDAAAKPVA